MNEHNTEQLLPERHISSHRLWSMQNRINTTVEQTTPNILEQLTIPSEHRN